MNLTEKKPFVSAVIVAAGTSSRMKGIDKQALLIGGVPVLLRTLMAFQQAPSVSEIVVVTQQEKIPGLTAQIEEYRLDKVCSLVPGGSTRQESVSCGIAACSKDTAFYAIHDGARPLITGDCIARCIDDAEKTGASFPAVPLQDTIKRIDENGFVESTPSRERIFCTQTPQVFASGLYHEAMAQAVKDGKSYTDDCQLIESIGHRVHMVLGEVTNLKITTPQDIPLAQAILAEQEK